jgi:hypothetical protein
LARFRKKRPGLTSDETAPCFCRFARLSQCNCSNITYLLLTLTVTKSF